MLLCHWVTFVILSVATEILGGSPSLSISSTKGTPQEGLNEKPIIGILTHTYTDTPLSGHQDKHYGQEHLPAPPVQLVEGGGGRVVPIFSGWNESMLRHTLNRVNGLFLPGASVTLTDSGYAKAGQFLYNLAIELNDNGTYFPVWGQCLGLQFMMHRAAGGDHNVQTKCHGWNTKLAVNFTSEASSSRLYGVAPNWVISNMTSKPILSHNHHFCVTLDSFVDLGLNKMYRILTLNYDEPSKFNYISSVEAIKYPFYGLAFQPESTLYSWARSLNIDHSPEALDVAQYFAQFLVHEASLNDQHFDSLEQQSGYLIDNYLTDIVPSRIYASETVQVYFFPSTNLTTK